MMQSHVVVVVVLSALLHTVHCRPQGEDNPISGVGPSIHLLLPDNLLDNFGCLFGCGEDTGAELTDGTQAFQVTGLDIVPAGDPSLPTQLPGCLLGQGLCGGCSGGGCNGNVLAAIPDPNSQPLIVLLGEDSNNQTEVVVLGNEDDQGILGTTGLTASILNNLYNSDPSSVLSLDDLGEGVAGIEDMINKRIEQGRQEPQPRYLSTQEEDSPTIQRMNGDNSESSDPNPGTDDDNLTPKDNPTTDSPDNPDTGDQNPENSDNSPGSSDEAPDAPNPQTDKPTGGNSGENADTTVQPVDDGESTNTLDEVGDDLPVYKKSQDLPEYRKSQPVEEVRSGGGERLDTSFRLEEPSLDATLLFDEEEVEMQPRKPKQGDVSSEVEDWSSDSSGHQITPGFRMLHGDSPSTDRTTMEDRQPSQRTAEEDRHPSQRTTVEDSPPSRTTVEDSLSTERITLEDKTSPHDSRNGNNFLKKLDSENRIDTNLENSDRERQERRRKEGGRKDLRAGRKIENGGSINLVQKDGGLRAGQRRMGCPAAMSCVRYEDCGPDGYIIGGETSRRKGRGFYSGGRGMLQRCRVGTGGDLISGFCCRN